MCVQFIFSSVKIAELQSFRKALCTCTIKDIVNDLILRDLPKQIATCCRIKSLRCGKIGGRLIFSLFSYNAKYVVFCVQLFYRAGCVTKASHEHQEGADQG